MEEYIDPDDPLYLIWLARKLKISERLMLDHELRELAKILPEFELCINCPDRYKCSGIDE